MNAFFIDISSFSLLSVFFLLLTSRKDFILWHFIINRVIYVILWDVVSDNNVKSYEIRLKNKVKRIDYIYMIYVYMYFCVRPSYERLFFNIPKCVNTSITKFLPIWQWDKNIKHTIALSRQLRYAFCNWY